MHFSFLIYWNDLSSTCFEYIKYSPKGAVTVYAAYGNYRASALLKY
jgi:hypothetical protein